MRKTYQKLIITFLLIIAFTFSAAAAQIQTSPNANQINLATDVFDGYSGIEVTDYGLLGYNYAIIMLFRFPMVKSFFLVLTLGLLMMTNVAISISLTVGI